ncbi:hypothetical protein Moror_594 [Moniliophthora roreri MCA 2997]|uniref:Uncharacterized protein n=1 Tax=Moniliophthora roreri (strain MCA 2997) TaxID=1381753 RepID=V2WT48_MONRO|nr:hypothetical protein Moror_594 [Moniliophthora roreri MCA 2997]
MARLEDLALELFEKIATLLDKQDQKSLRLVDKNASVSAKGILFATITIPRTVMPISELMRAFLSDQFNDIARHVKHLTWNTLNMIADGTELPEDGELELILGKFKSLKELKLNLHKDTPDLLYRIPFNFACTAGRDLARLLIDGKSKPPSTADFIEDIIAKIAAGNPHDWSQTVQSIAPSNIPPSTPFSSLSNLRGLYIRPGMLKSFQDQIAKPLSFAIPNCPNLTHLTLDIEGPLALSRQPLYAQDTPRLATVFSRVSLDMTLKLEELNVKGMITDIPPSIERHFCLLKRADVGHLHDSLTDRFWTVLGRLGVRLESITSFLDDETRMYLASYSGVVELDLDVGGSYGTTSWQDTDDLYQCFYKFFNTAIARHCDSIRVLHLPEDYYCYIRVADVSVIARCTKLESLRLAVNPIEQCYSVPELDYLSQLLHAAIRHNNLHTMYFSVQDGGYDCDEGQEYNQAKRWMLKERIQEIPLRSDHLCRRLILYVDDRVIYELKRLEAGDGLCLYRFCVVRDDDSDDDEDGPLEKFEGPHLVVLILIMLIEMATSRSPETVWEALDGGLVTAMFKAQRFYAYKKPEASGRGGNGGL